MADSDTVDVTHEDDDEDVIHLDTEDDDDKSEEDPEFEENLAETLDEETLDDLANKYVLFADRDRQDRQTHFERYADGLKKTGLTRDPPSGPALPNGSEIIYPVLTEACIDFQSATMGELYPPQGPVRIDPGINATAYKLRKSTRKAAYLNNKIIREIKEYRSTLEQVLSQVPLSGNAYRKFWWNTRYKRPECEFLPLDHVLLPFNASSFETASRVTLIQNLAITEINRRIRTGFYKKDVIDPSEEDTPLEEWKTEPEEVNNDIEDKISLEGSSSHGYRTIFEIYCDLDLPDDPEYDEEWGSAPYILTIDVLDKKVLSLYRNWAKDDKTGTKKHYIVSYGLIPWRGVYNLGLTHIAGPLSGLLSGMLRAMMDNLQYAALPTAISASRPGIPGQNVELMPGQIIPMELMGQTKIQDAIMPIPFNPIPPIMLQMFELLDQTTRNLLRTSLSQIGTDTTEVPVGTMQARIEQGLKVYKAIFARLHESQRLELDIICRLYSEHMETVYEKNDEGEILKDAKGKKQVSLDADDFKDSSDLQPVADPSVFSETQRLLKWQIADQAVQQYPQLFDIKTYTQIKFERLGIPNTKEILPDSAPKGNDNPATENVKMAMGSPTNVLPDQDHAAHIAVHLRGLGSPIIGDNQLFQANMQPMVLAHVKQHILMMYAKMILEAVNKKLGEDVTEVASVDQQFANKVADTIAEIHPEVEAKLILELGPIVKELEQVQIQVQKVIQQKQAQNPQAQMLQMQQQELQLKQQEVQGRQQKDQGDASVANLEVQARNQADQTARMKVQADVLQSLVQDAQVRDTAQAENNKEIGIEIIRAASQPSTAGASNDSVGA